MLGDGLVSLIVFDPTDVLSRKAETVRRFSSFAIDHCRKLQVIPCLSEANSLLQGHKGRRICTTPDEVGGTDIGRFAFRQDDLLIFGNEFRGLPQDILAQGHHRVFIPMRGPAYERPDLGGKVRGVGTQRCLGVSASIAIFLYVALNQVPGP